MTGKTKFVVYIPDDVPLIDEEVKELNLCMCDEPIKKYSKSGCYCCWSCKKCGKFGGCDNMYWMSGLEQIKERQKNEQY